MSRPAQNYDQDVTTILLSGAISMVIALLGTRRAITVLRERKLGQQVRTDGPQAHLSKSGTPTMGGIVIIVFELAGWAETTIVMRSWLVAGMFVALGLWVFFYRSGVAGLPGF